MYCSFFKNGVRYRTKLEAVAAGGRSATVNDEFKRQNKTGKQKAKEMHSPWTVPTSEWVKMRQKSLRSWRSGRHVAP